jgi:hypothetical protein
VLEALATAKKPRTALAKARRQAGDLSRYRNDPVGFSRDILGTELWEKQREIAQAIADGEQRISVRSGHKTGKTRLLACLALWWLFTRDEAQIIVTSASGRQVRSVIWKEIRNVALRSARVKLPSVSDGLHKVPDAGYQLEDGRVLLGFSTSEPEKMAGFSGPEQLFLLDEASGIDEEIFEAIEGNRAGGVVIVMFSNPTRTSGEFFESHHRKAKSPKNPHGYKTFRLSSEDAAKVTPHIRGLARQDYIDEKRAEWGVDSTLYAVRILGEFPKQGASSVIPLHMVHTARERGRQYAAHHRPRLDDAPEDVSSLLPDPADRLEIGVDVARSGGDKSVIALRRGPLVYPLRRFVGLDSKALALEVLKAVECFNARAPNVTSTPRVKVDANGVGAGVFDELAWWANEHPGELIVIGVMSSASPTRDERTYANLRAQMAFETRSFLASAALPDDDHLEQDLLTPEYRFAKDRRLLIESKDELFKRLGRSPDDGDALNLCVYEPPINPQANDDVVGSASYTR